MVVLAVANDSGSVGKTSFVVALAAILAHEDSRSVRVVDLDQQANASRHLGCSRPEFHIGQVLRREKFEGTDRVRHRPVSFDEAEVETAIPGLTLVPGSRDLKADAVELNRSSTALMRLRTSLQAAAPVDVTLLDCPGTVNVISINAIVASDAVLTVTKPGAKEVGGIGDLLQTIDEVAEVNETVRLAAIIPSEVPPTGRVYRDTIDALKKNQRYASLLTPEIRRSVLVPESYSHRLPLPIYAPESPVADDYREVRNWLKERGILA